MANNYTEIMKLVNAGNKMGLSNTITRDNGIPLDLSSVQPSYEAAVIYAATKAIAYIGQPIAVGDKLYIISDTAAEEKFVAADNTEYDNYLVEVGSKTEGDGLTIDLVDGVLMLHGIDLETTTAGMLPQVEVVDGKKQIKWVSISQIVQGDGNKVTTLTSTDGSVKITATEDTDTSLVYDLSVEHPDAPEYAIAKDERAEGATETTYHLTKDGENVDVAIVVPDAYNDSALAGRVKAIEDDYLKEADKYDDTALSNRVKAIEDAGYQTANDVATALNPYATTEYVNTEVAKKADKAAYDQTVLDLDALEARVEAFLTGTGTEAALDSLQELITYINTHDDTDISGILSSIQAIENKLVGVDTTVAAYVTAAIEALQIGDYAKAADLTALAGRVETLEAKPFDTYASKTEVTEAAGAARTGAVADVEAKGYAVATEVANTYATKDELTAHNNTMDTKLNDYAKKADVEAELAKKIENGTIAHTSEGVDEGVTLDGTTLKIVVDAYTKAETLTKIEEKITEINGGESAGEVLSALNSYKETNDAAIAAINGKIGTAGAGQNGEGDTLYSLIAKAQGQADTGVTNAATAQGTANEAKTAAEKNATDIAGHLTRIGALETTKGEHVAAISDLTGRVGTLEAEDVKINEAIGTINGELTTIKSGYAAKDAELAALIGANTEAIAKKAEAENVYTKGEVDNLLANLDQSELEQGIADNKAAIEAIYKVDGETVSGILADEIARATAAEKVNANAIAALIGEDTGKTVRGIAAEETAKIVAGAGEDYDTLVEIAAYIASDKTNAAEINNTLSAHNAILAGIGGENQPATVSALVAAEIAKIPAYDLPAATKDVLGGVKLSDEIGVNTNGQLEVKTLSTDKLVQGSEALVLNGGSAKVNANA